MKRWNFQTIQKQIYLNFDPYVNLFRGLRRQACFALIQGSGFIS